MDSTNFPYDPKWLSVDFVPPTKKILNHDDALTFTKSHTHADYIAFLTKLQQAVRGKKISDTQPIPKFEPFREYFEGLQKLLDQTPPIQQPMRFGNKAFRDWIDKADTYTDEFLQKFLPEPLQKARPELYRYVAESFGNKTRIDYGTGHELSFMFFCWALYRLGFYNDSEMEQMVRQVFYRYINTMRKLQIQYKLEPAGSHGVWGLDDYHFLPFLLGAAEIIGNKNLESPLCIHEDGIVKDNFKQYMYLNCIQFIKEQKSSAPFRDTSPVLDNISGAANWEKIMNGMIKMYQAEVLAKFPVVQHTYFGTIIPFV